MSKDSEFTKADRKSIIEKAWEEIKKINWAEINEQCDAYHTIAIVGNEQERKNIMSWLTSYSEDVLRSLNLTPYPDQYDPKKLRDSTHEINCEITGEKQTSDLKNHASEIKNALLCLTTEAHREEMNKLSIPAYFIEVGSNDDTVHRIISNFPEFRFALSHSYPRFRTAHATIEIQETAVQNAVWAIGTAAPNIIPGPQQAVTAPIEAISDFVILTTNEVKLTFELTGLSGRYVNPIKCMIEFGILVGLAKAAEVVATNTTGKIPAGAGIVTKGAVAYAFTSAIGWAIYLYIITGKKLANDEIERLMKDAYEKGKSIVESIVKKRHGPETKEEN